jgi:hypothetical protein
MSYLAAAVAILVFAAAFRRSGLVEAARATVSLSTNTFGTLRRDDISDEEKEAITQAASIGLFKGFVGITWRAALVFLASLAPLVVFDFLQLAPYVSSIAAILSWEVIVGGTIVFLLINFAGSRSPD